MHEAGTCAHVLLTYAVKCGLLRDIMRSSRQLPALVYSGSTPSRAASLMRRQIVCNC